MSRSILIGLVVAFGAGAPSAWAAATAPMAMSDTASVLSVRYGGCEPGYKLTSHGGCKLSHYLRHHPGQNPNNYEYQERPRYGDDYGRPRPRYYDQGDGY